MFGLMADNMVLFKQFNGNSSLQKWFADMVYGVT